MGRRIARNDVLFGGLLLTAGVLELLDGPWVSPKLSTLFFCLEYLIYTLLLLGWISSLYQSLLPSPARREIIAAGSFLLLLVFLRFFKYRVAQGAPELERLAWYCYYLPFIMVPTLFSMCCVSMNRAGGGRGREMLLLLPAILLTALVLTNDLHGLAFRALPGAEPLTGRDGSYRYGPVAILSYLWSAAMLMLGAGALIRATRRAGRSRGLGGVFWVLALWLAVLTAYYLLGVGSRYRAFQLPEIHAFAMIGVFEACFRGRMIPRNRDYERVFRSLLLPAAVTDRDLELVYPTADPIPAHPSQLRQALTAPCLLDPDTRLNGRALDRGCAFWIDDESTLNRLNERLEEVNRALLQENDLLRREQEQAEERAAVEARNRLYNRAAQAVYPAQKRISELLAAAEPDTPSFRLTVAKVLVLTAYVKRMSNFVMVAAERDRVSAGELGAAIQESIHYLSCCGVSASVDMTAHEDLPCARAMALYSCFESLVEALHGQTRELWLRLSDGALLLMADCAEAPVLPRLPHGTRTRWEDGQLLVTLEMGGAAS